MLGSSTANIKAIITADDRASATISKFGTKTSKVATALKYGLVTAGAAALAFGVASVKSFTESEDAIAQLNAVLKSTGGVAGVTSEMAIELAESLQKVTKFSDEEILSAENLLLTFTKINKSVFPETIEIVTDMSTALGQDLKSSAIQVGKALQDPILGVTALRRVGVNFSTAQRDVIKKLVETGQSAKAQAMILKELQVEFGGSARAAGETFSGKLAILGNRFDEVKEKVGGFIAGGLIKLTNVFFDTQTETDITGKKLRELQVSQDIAKGATQRLKDAQNNYNAAVKRYGPASAQAKKAHEALTRAEIQHKLATNSVKDAQRGLNSAEYSYRLNTPKMLTAIQKRINKFGLIVDFVGSAITSVGQLDAAIEGIGGGGKPVDIQKALNSGGLARQMGGPVTSRKPYIVGERGPELFVPQSSGSIKPNNQLAMGGGGTTINMNVNIGMFAGTQMERRKVAKMLFRDFQDVAAQIGITPSALLDKSNGAIIR